MKFTYKDKTYHFPTSLSKIKLGDRIGFDKLYGKKIQEMREDLYKVGDDGNIIPADETDVMFTNIYIAIMNFSFFTGIPIEEVESSISIENVLNIYHTCFHQIYEQEKNVILEDGYLWNGEIWFIEQPTLTYESQITFNELITSKQIVKQMHELGSGNWESMVYLAAIFLKRKDDVFDESWLSADGEKVKMMYDLPMDIAMAVGFFLQISMSTYMQTLQYSAEEVAEKVRT